MLGIRGGFMSIWEKVFEKPFPRMQFGNWNKIYIVHRISAVGSIFVSFYRGLKFWSPGGLTMVWPEGAISKIQASKIALDIDFSCCDIEEKSFIN